VPAYARPKPRMAPLRTPTSEDSRWSLMSAMADRSSGRAGGRGWRDDVSGTAW
jgi:hypothetical protein